MKAIIFDVDNTLIDWKDEFVFALRNLLKEINKNISEDEINKIDYILDNTDTFLTNLDKELLFNKIQEVTNFKLPNDFLDKLIERQGLCFYEDNELVKTISYLSKKYDLYVISNWFTKTQELRLENVGIKKYFKGIYGADINYFKPDPKCFNVILNKYEIKECVYIGDKLDIDILPAYNIGMDVIWKTNEINSDFKTIKNINELRDIL